jgi:hypothetical protein
MRQKTRLHRFFSHMKGCPNSRARYSLYFSLRRAKAWRSCVLELGCASGTELRALAVSCECPVVHGVDIAGHGIKLAILQYGTDTLNFFQHDSVAMARML